MASTACRSGADIPAQLSTTRARSGQPASEICAPICAHGSEVAPEPDSSSITCDADASGSKPAARIPSTLNDIWGRLVIHCHLVWPRARKILAILNANPPLEMGCCQSSGTSEKKNPLASSGGTRAAGCPWGDLFGRMFGPGGDLVNSASGGRRRLRDQSARTAVVLILRHGVKVMT